MRFQVISLGAILLAPFSATATPIASPRGGGGSSGGFGGGSVGGSFGGARGGGSYGGSSGGGYKGSSSYSPSSSSSSSRGSFAAGAATGYVGGIWYVPSPPISRPSGPDWQLIGLAMAHTPEQHTAGRPARSPRPTASSPRP